MNSNTLSISEMNRLHNVLCEKRDQLLTLANSMGACTLDGEPAVLRAPDMAVGRAFWRVVTRSGDHAAVFTERVVDFVLKQKGGNFRTRECRQYACI